MKFLGSLLAMAVLLAGCSAGEDEPAGLPGPVPDGVLFHEPDPAAPPAPAFELNLLNGDVLKASTQWAERPIVMVFFESWCELCSDQQPAINELAEDYEDVVLFVGVAGLSTQDDVAEYVRANDTAYPVGIDDGGDVWLNYAASEAPHIILITKGGRVARGWPGGLDGDRLREQIDDFLVQTQP